MVRQAQRETTAGRDGEAAAAGGEEAAHLRLQMQQLRQLDAEESQEAIEAAVLEASLREYYREQQRRR